jgi:hypothetical protein
MIVTIMMMLWIVVMVVVNAIVAIITAAAIFAHGAIATRTATAVDVAAMTVTGRFALRTTTQALWSVSLWLCLSSFIVCVIV